MIKCTKDVKRNGEDERERERKIEETQKWRVKNWLNSHFKEKKNEEEEEDQNTRTQMRRSKLKTKKTTANIFMFECV